MALSLDVNYLLIIILSSITSCIFTFFISYLKKKGEFVAQKESTELLKTVESKVDKLFNKKERYDLLLLEKIELYAQQIFDIHATLAPRHHALVIDRIEYASVFESANKAVLIQKMYFPELEEVTNNLFNLVSDLTAANYLCHGLDAEYNVRETREGFSPFEKEIVTTCENAIKKLQNYISTNLNPPISK